MHMHMHMHMHTHMHIHVHACACMRDVHAHGREALRWQRRTMPRVAARYVGLSHPAASRGTAGLSAPRTRAAPPPAVRRVAA